MTDNRSASGAREGGRKQKRCRAAFNSKPNNKIEANLVDADDAHIKLEWKAKEPKPVGKGKIVVNKQSKIAYDDILEAKVVIKF